jgi:hypothetical protein
VTQPTEAAIIEPLVRDLVEWVAKEPRQYRDVIDTWRTSCPRLMVWEAASDRGFVERKLVDGQGSCVVVTQAGQSFVNAYAKPTPRAFPALIESKPGL